MRIANVTSTVILEGYHAVPVADAVANVLMRDVVGNKADASGAILGTTKSLMAYVKALIFFLTKTAVNNANNTYFRDIVGNKADTLVEAVGTTKSIIAYEKGLIQELHQRSVPHVARHYSTSNALIDVVNITDKGVLTGVSGNCDGADDVEILITLDGTVILPQCRVIDSGGYTFALSFNHRFNTSLRVQHKNNGNVADFLTIVTYTTD